MEKTPRIAIIGGSGFEQGFEQAFATYLPLPVETPYGLVSDISAMILNSGSVIFLSRHGKTHSIPPHKINYRANIWALHKIGIEKIISLNAVGAINNKFEQCDIVVPHDFMDFTKTISNTFYDKDPVTHIDMSIPYCPELRRIVIEKLKLVNLAVWEKAVFVCTEGPRFETPAEIEMFRRLGGDIIGMTGVPEAILARELGLCYASICYISNKAAGLQETIAQSELLKNAKQISSRIGQALIETIGALPLAHNCPCSSALRNARF